MLSALVWDALPPAPAGVRRHLASGLTITAEPDADIYEVLAGGTPSAPATPRRLVDVHGVWLSVSVETTAPGGLSGAAGGDGQTLGEAWLAMLAGQAVRYRPDADAPDVEIPVVPDVSDRATLLAVASGTILPGTAALKLKSRDRYAPGSALLAALVAASPYRRLAAPV